MVPLFPYMLSLDFLKNSLNTPQREGVLHEDGPLLILAGAGSGKTRVLTYRIANLVAKGRAKPDEILAVTFTNKAAREMEERTSKLLRETHVPVYGRLWISTFHSTCVRILRDHIESLGYTRSFVIYDDSEQQSVVKKVCEQLQINDKIYPARTFLSRISECKRMGIPPSGLAANRSNFIDQKAAEVYAAYEKEMKRSNALDFDDLLLKTLDLFRSQKDVLRIYQNKFRYVLVDEYQDTNQIQYQLMKMIVEPHHNICVVGDEDQSIYSWRGADIQNILNFERDFPGAQVIKLEQNYRSTQTIVEAASALIAQNTERKGKTLFTDNPRGEMIRVQEEASEHDEARFVVRNIAQLAASGEYSYSDFAVFYRTNAQSRVLEDQLRSNQIPYRLFGSVKFYDRQEIKDIMGYFRLLHNPKDDLSFKRVINRPPRRIGSTSLEALDQLGFEQGLTLLEAAHYALQNRSLHSGALKGLTQFLSVYANLKQEALTSSLSELYQMVLETTGYIEMLKAERTTEAEARIENLQELYNAIREFEKERAEEGTLQTFLEEIALVSDLDQADSDQPAITLMTLHLSKGLEFPVVFVVGVEEGLFPSRQSLANLDPSQLEEERRLMYVGMTRSRQRLFLTHARKRLQWGQEQMNPPSRFLNEIPPSFLEKNSSIAAPRFMRYYQRPLNDITAPKIDETEDFFEPSSRVDADFPRGSQVRHPTFGIGTIHKAEGAGDSRKVTVLFGTTLRTFAIKYARLERVE